MTTQRTRRARTRNITRSKARSAAHAIGTHVLTQRRVQRNLRDAAPLLATFQEKETCDEEA